MKSKIIEIAYTCGFTTTQEITQALLKTSVETTKYEKHPFYNVIYIYIYALTCQTCGKNYIGQTERSVRDRNGD